MYKKILIATDGSELASRAVTHGLQLAKNLNVPVILVTVTQLWSAMDIAHEARLGHQNPVEHYEEMAAAWAKKNLDAAGALAKTAGVSFETCHVPDKTPAEGIIATAEKEGCDLIVMASHGRRGIGRLVLGSQVSEVLAHSKVPALIVR